MLDLMMPEMDGQRVFAAARFLNYSAPVVLVSASPELQKVAARLGCSHVAKPFLPELLLGRIAEQIEDSLRERNVEHFVFDGPVTL